MSHITTCPRCSTRISVSEGITEKTLICPHCLANVENAWPGSQIRADDINTDVKRDIRAGSIVLAALIGLCVLGTAIALFVVPPGDAKAELLMFSFAPLCILIPITMIRRGIPRTCGIVLIALGTIMACLIFFFFTCLIIAFGPHH